MIKEQAEYVYVVEWHDLSSMYACVSACVRVYVCTNGID